MMASKPNDGENMSTLQEQRMIAAHKLGTRDYLENRAMLVPVYLTDEHEIVSYHAGYQGAKRRDTKLVNRGY
jgi:hypothetical protein